MGLSVRSVQTRSLMTEGMDHAAIARQYYEPPLVNIIPYACHVCPANRYWVTDVCQNCLAASCQQVCPREAISFVNGKSRIDTAKSVRSGKGGKRHQKNTKDKYQNFRSPLHFIQIPPIWHLN